ncbi:MAG TPA: aminotransferase class V-fold PLP-dependent enzyme [Candidatus Paceibacterota bacterium]|jgi:cysteine desulfurase
MELFRSKRVYLDWASSAPVSRATGRVFLDTLSEYGNPASPHKEGLCARDLLTGSRTTIARLAEVKPDGVVFTSGATEANNLALTGTVMALREKGEKDIHALYLPSAHASVIETLRALEKWGVRTEAICIRDGALDLSKFRDQLQPATRLVVLDAVCGETGTRWDVRGASVALDAYARESENSRPLLHVDASQAPLGLPWSLTRFGADMVAVDAQKVGGVRGIGALCARSHARPSPIMRGGGQEGGVRPGTEPVALAAAFAAALTEVEARRSDFALRAESAREKIVASIMDELPNVEVNVGKEGVPHILNLSLLGRDTDYLVMLLDKEGFAAATKSACETDSEQGSRAVLALTGTADRAKATLRVSWGPSTSAGELERFADALVRAVRFLDRT